MTVDKFGGALLVQSWREPLTRGDVFDLCDAAFGGQLTAGEDVHSVWVHPRARLNRDGSSGSGDAGTDASPGVYRRASWKPEKGGSEKGGSEKGGSELDAFEAADLFGPDVFGRDLSDPELGHAFKELGLAYTFVPPRRFGDPSLYLDFRPTRRWIGEHARGVSVLNAFAYTCGAGLAAAAAGASRVLNTDHSATYLAYGAENYRLNGLGGAPGAPETERDETCAARASAFDAYCEDFYPAVRQLAGLSPPGRQGRGGGRGSRRALGGGARGRHGGFSRGGAAPKKAKPPRPETFDLVILDPPTLTKTSYGAVDIENDYQSLAKPSALCVTPGGVLLATNHSHRVDLDDWLAIVEKCVTKAGCAVTRVEVVRPEPDDDDHPAMADGKRPLKVAAFTLE